jgi:murein DD-endopeptidase MepM/ murein hydrolase activator NlpD
MTDSRQAVTIMIHRDGDLQSRTIRLPLWALRLAIFSSFAMLVLILLAAALYLPMAGAAASVPFLRSEISRLQQDNAKIRELTAALDSAESRYSQLRHMMGGDMMREPSAIGSALPLAPPIQARPAGTSGRYELGPSLPHHWPLDEPGYLTRGQIGTGTVDEAHPGIDIAVPTGALVRAAGGGTVIQAGPDPEYGSFVVLQHPEGYQSVYGHLSRLLVEANDTVVAGRVIGLSGNSGRSSAPHLHFEIRRDQKSLDPLTLVKEGS